MAEQGLARINHKRFYLPMLQNRVLLARHTRKPPNGRKPECRVTTIHSKLRRNFGCFEIQHSDGGVVPMTFLIDAFDREIIDRTAANGCFL